MNITETGDISLQLTESHLKILESSQNSMLPLQGKMRDNNGKEITLDILFFVGISSSKMLTETEAMSMGESVIEVGFKNITRYLFNQLNKNSYLLFGLVINSKNKFPIMVMYYHELKRGIYTIDFHAESYRDILPEGILPPN